MSPGATLIHPTHPHHPLRGRHSPSPNSLRRRLVARDDGHPKAFQKRRVAHTAVDDRGDASASAHGARQQVPKAAHALRIHACPKRNNARGHLVDRR